MRIPARKRKTDNGQKNLQRLLIGSASNSHPQQPSTQLPASLRLLQIRHSAHRTTMHHADYRQHNALKTTLRDDLKNNTNKKRPSSVPTGKVSGLGSCTGMVRTQAGILGWSRIHCQSASDSYTYLKWGLTLPT
jgi:hypothetical protein